KRPAGRRLSICEPDRILFLVVHDDLVLGVRIARHRGAPVDLQALQAAHVAAVANASGVPACRASRAVAAPTRNREHGTRPCTSVRNRREVTAANAETVATELSPVRQTSR